MSFAAGRPNSGVHWSLGVGFMQEHCLLRNFDGFDGTAMSYTVPKMVVWTFGVGRTLCLPPATEKFRGLPMPSSTYLSQSSHFAFSVCVSVCGHGKVRAKCLGSQTFTESCKWSVTPPFFLQAGPRSTRSTSTTPRGPCRPSSAGPLSTCLCVVSWSLE